MAISFIENKRIRVGTRSDYGARVVSLMDKATGRDWMTRGEASANTGEDAAYGAAEAVGWDECFPTVSPWDGTGTPWGRRLRDHGDLWGRPFTVTALGPDAITQRRDSPEIAFTRTLALDGDTLAVRYHIANHGAQPLPYLWALHALLAVRPEDRIVLPGIETVNASHMALGGKRLEGGDMVWPDAGGRRPLRLDEAQPAESAFVAKFLASGSGGSAAVGQGEEWLQIGWDDTISDLGIWLTYGGWPAPGGHYEIALEPTTAPANHLGEAIAAGAAPLQPGATREWCVWFRFGQP